MLTTSDISSFLKSFLIYPQGAKDLATFFKIGEELDANIIRYIDRNRVLISTKNLELSAEVNLPFQEGEKIKIRVESLTPRIVLKLISRDASLRGAYLKLANTSIFDSRNFSDIFHEFKNIFNDTNKFGLLTNKEDFVQLVKLLMNIFSFSESGFTFEKIKQLIKNFCLSYETEVAQAAMSKDEISIFSQKTDNLKLLLLNFLEILSTTDDMDVEKGEMQKLSKLLKGMLQNIDFNHIQGQQSDSRIFCFNVPLFYGDEKSKLDFLLDFKKKDENTDKADLEITIITELSAIGKIRITVFFVKDQILSSILLSNRLSAEFLKDNLNILSQSLLRVGIDKSRLSTKVLCDENPESYVVDTTKYFQRVPIVDFRI
jgi:hypothetical protein